MGGFLAILVAIIIVGFVEQVQTSMAAEQAKEIKKNKSENSRK